MVADSGARAAAASALEASGLAPFAATPAGELAYGQRRQLVLALALPLPVLLAMALGVVSAPPSVKAALIAINAGLVLLRVLLLGALVGSYERAGVTFWLSPLADVLAVVRVLLSTVRRPRTWRGRTYG